MPFEEIYPQSALESAVVCKNNSAIVDLIARGAELTRPDILATQEAFDLLYPVALLLMESSACLRNESAVKRLEELGAHEEMVDLVADLTLPLPENMHPKSQELIDALLEGDELAVANLVANDKVPLSDAPMEAFDNMDEFHKFSVESLFTDAVAPRLKARLFLHLRDKAEKDADSRAALHFEVLKIILCEKPTPVRDISVHTLWHKRTAPAFVLDIEQEPEKFTDDYLASFIMDGDLEPDIRPFHKFPPYYQALLLNNAGASCEQFDNEANIEAFDAKAVFELLSASNEYEARVNWVLVNLTAKASDFLKFLSKCPQYANCADWQMINVQADPEEWLEFLEKQPAFVENCWDHTSLYTLDPDRWEKILKSSGLPKSNCRAYIDKFGDDDKYEYCFKVRLFDDHAEFFEVNDLYNYKKFSNLARRDFEEFSAALQQQDGDGRFINIIR